MLTVTRASHILIEGDSINDQALQYQCMNATLAWIDSNYLVPSGNAWRRPTHVNKSVTGQSTTSIAGRIVADIATGVFTHVLLQIGINDSQLSISQATSIANANTILTACRNAGLPGIWIGPLCNGEKWPTGQNALDLTNPGIDLLDNALATLVPTYPGWSYISTRKLVYAVAEPTLNPGQLNSGVLTGLVAASGPGLHPNPSGAALITPLVQAQIAFA